MTDQSAAERKTYSTPRLVRYGTLTEITRTTNMVSGFNDGQMDKT